MGQKRQRDAHEANAPDLKKRKGFRVGPEHLPDGPWKRKSKATLIVLLRVS